MLTLAARSGIFNLFWINIIISFNKNEQILVDNPLVVEATVKIVEVGLLNITSI